MKSIVSGLETTRGGFWWQFRRNGWLVGDNEAERMTTLQDDAQKKLPPMNWCCFSLVDLNLPHVHSSVEGLESTRGAFGDSDLLEIMKWKGWRRPRMMLRRIALQELMLLLLGLKPFPSALQCFGVRKHQRGAFGDSLEEKGDLLEIMKRKGWRRSRMMPRRNCPPGSDAAAPWLT